MDVCKCIVPARHGDTLNSHRAANPLVRLVEGEERREASDHPQSDLPLNWGGIERNRTVTCMVLKATANDRRHLALCHDEFRWHRSGHCRSGATEYRSRRDYHDKMRRPRTSEIYDLFIIMSDISDISDFMDFSPTRQSKVAACEKLRDTVHSISAMHSSISEGASTPTKKNSFLELYQMTSYDLAKKKTRCRKKEPLSETPRKSEFSPLNGLKGISFANVVSGEVPNQIPIDDKKKIPHGFLSQDSNNTSDLTQVLELFQIISNLVKKNPKILDLLTKFKKANSDEEKTCLLAEAIMDKV
ncbi:uncharacterized protein TNCV_1514061 [Trichonephila clavipes]|nr:uncharacterized protein TNCV_1514061 [Trichonephila clavipes]